MPLALVLSVSLVQLGSTLVFRYNASCKAGHNMLLGLLEVGGTARMLGQLVSGLAAYLGDAKPASKPMEGSKWWTMSVVVVNADQLEALGGWLEQFRELD